MRIAAFPDFCAVETLYLPHQIGGSMRSAQIQVAIAQGNNRFGNLSTDFEGSPHHA
jgi:hypothetical protein